MVKALKINLPVAVVFLSIIVYLPILKNDFVYDDHFLIKQNDSIQSLSNLPDFFSRHLWSFYKTQMPLGGVRYWRPILLTLLALIYKLFGVNPTGYHLASVLMHGLCTMLIFLVGREVLGEERVAAVAAAVFAFHPVHVEAVAWASGLSDLLVTAFALATICSYHWFRTHQASRWGFATIILLVLTFLSKESGVVMPGVLVAYEFLLAPRKSRRSSLALIAGSFLAALVYLAVRRIVIGPLELKILGLSPDYLLNTVLVVTGHQSRLLLFPVHLSASYPTQIYKSLFEPEVIRPLFFITLMVIFLATAIRSRKDLFWVAWTGLALLPSMTVIGFAHDLLAERYLYLPSVGFIFIVANFLVSRSDKQRLSKTAAVLLVLLLSGFVVRDLDRFPDWRDELTYLKVTVRDAPNSCHQHFNLGHYLKTKLKDKDGAQKIFERVTRQCPSLARPHHSLALIFQEKKEYHKALHHSLKASDLSPAWVSPLIVASDAANQLGRTDQARAHLQKVLSLEPDNPKAHTNMGSLALMEGKVHEALKWWKVSEELDSSNERVLFNLAMGYEMIGEIKKAVLYYKRFNELAPPEMDQLKLEALRKYEELSRKNP
jgi:4-amino-4-deoxy-L-arabinose transferase-like glycosyltransferase